MTDANTICHDLDLLGDWLDAKGYTEEAGLCTRAMDEINRLRAENARLEKAVIELTEENRLIGLQMDRFADEIERLREALKNARAEALKEGAEIAFAYNGMPRSEIAQAFARAAMGESDG